MADALAKEKRYNLFPELLDLHVERLIRADRAARSYLQKTPLLSFGLIKIEQLLGGETAKAVDEQIGRSLIFDGKQDQTRVVNLKGTVCHEVCNVIYPIIMGMFEKNALPQAKKHFGFYTYLQHLFNRPEDKDEQKLFHTDTFFHCVKFWYFPHDVEDDNGAFWYVPYSPVLTDKLVAWHSRRVKDLKEGKSEKWRGLAHREGSFRISTEEIRALGLEPLAVGVKADTLVIGNVFGFHRRGDTKTPTHRHAIHGSIRFNDPFAFAKM